MYLNGEHYRVNLDQLERVIKAIKWINLKGGDINDT
jgi:hypothetical protein